MSLFLISFESMRLVSTNIPSARTTVKSASSRPTIVTFAQGNETEFIDYSLLDTAR